MFLIQDYAPQYPGYYLSFKHAILLYTINELTGWLIYSTSTVSSFTVSRARANEGTQREVENRQPNQEVAWS